MYDISLMALTALAFLSILGVFFRIGFSHKQLVETIENKFEKFERKFEDKFEKIDLRFGLVDKNYQQLITRVAILESKISV